MISTGTFHIIGNTLQLQKAPYIEDGWVIEVVNNNIFLFEIPQFGGIKSLVKQFDSIIEAVRYAEEMV